MISTRASGGIIGVAALLVVATLVRYGHGAEGIAWSLCQLLLVAIAWVDMRTRLIPTGVLVFAAGAFVALRSVYAPHLMAETIAAGVIAFAVFFLLALLFKGGLGMGDVELVGLLGFMLGADVVFALLAGCVAGSLAALTLIVLKRASLRSSFAYGPYLALGASLAIVIASPPPLV
jgi:prepilin signal peptidase PulO-like enzyme (type II secretory pathway)